MHRLKRIDQLEYSNFAQSQRRAREQRRCTSGPRKYLLLFECTRLQLLRRFLEFLVFDQLPNQIPARIIFVRILFRRLLIDRQQAAAFQVNQVRGHDHEFAGDIDIQFLESLEIFEILPGDSLEGNVVNVDLVPLD